MLSRGELKGKVWRFLNKTSAFPGFYDDDKMNDAIQEALNFIAVEMFLGGEGWLTDFLYFDTEDGQTSMRLPGNVALIREVRYKVSDVWYPIMYNDASDGFSYIGTGVQQAFTYQYRLLGSNIVFDPPLSMGGEKYLQVEAVFYPSQLTDDQQLIDQQFNAACVEYLKYKVASIVAASVEKSYIAWADQEAAWYQKMQAVVVRRTMASQPIREYLP